LSPIIESCSSASSIVVDAPTTVSRSFALRSTLPVSTVTFGPISQFSTVTPPRCGPAA
jgi:hypothetical protein